MSLHSPGGPGGVAVGQPHHRTSDPGSPAGKHTDNTLNALVADWSDRERAWQTVEHLRVMLCKHLRPVNTAEVDQLGRGLRHTWSAGRLSHIAKTLSLNVEPGHLDADWFDFKDANWWHPTLHGTDLEVDTAKALLALLETACGIAPTTPGEPSTWTWPTRSAYASASDAMNAAGNFPEPPKVAPIRIDWILSSAATSLSSSMGTGADGTCWLELTTPVTKRRDL